MKLELTNYGKETGTQIVFIHGWGLCSQVFKPIIPYLEENFKISLLDLPGYGVNHKIPANRCDGIIETLEETIPNNSIIFGWSLGATLAIKYAIRNPEKIKALITCCGSPKFCKEDNTWEGTENSLLQKFTSVLNESNCQSVIEKFLSLQAMGSQKLREDIKKIKELLKEVPTPSYYELQAGLKTLMDEDLRGYVSRIECPSLHIYGANDRLIPYASSRIWANNAHAEIKVIASASHAPFITEPEEFSKTLLNFLTKLN